MATTPLSSRQILPALYATRNRGLCHKEMCVPKTQTAKSCDKNTSNEHFEHFDHPTVWTSVDFLHLNKNIFITTPASVIIDHFSHVLTRCMPQPPNQGKQPQTKSLMTMHRDLVSQQESIMIRVVNLKTNWRSTAELLGQELLPTTPKGTGRLNGLTGP